MAMTSGDAPASWRISRRALDDPHRPDDFRDTQADDCRAALQRGVGPHPADGGPGRAVRHDRGSVPARTTVRWCRWSSACSRCCWAARAVRVQRRGTDHSRRARSPPMSSSSRLTTSRVPDDLGGVTAHGDRRLQSSTSPLLCDAQCAGAHTQNELLIVDGPERRHRQSRSIGACRIPAQARQFEIERKTKRLKTTRPTTLDGLEIELFANIELPDDPRKRWRTAQPASDCFVASSCFSIAKACPRRTSSSRPTVRSLSGWAAGR